MFKSLYLPLFTGVMLFGDVNLKDDLEFRFGLQSDNSDIDLALGGRVHLENRRVEGFKGSLTFATTNSIFGKNDAQGINFFDSNLRSYSILQEAYIDYEIKNSTFRVGRMIVDTPFANSDDVGMIANSFEAYSVRNRDLLDTTLSAMLLTKMSGVDCDTPQRFKKINDNSGVLAIGAVYEGISDISLSSWYYDIFSKAKYSYVDFEYSKEYEGYKYTLALQYANEDFRSKKDSSIYGVGVSFGFSSVEFALAYNKSSGASADNGFGGGPFLTSMEHLTLAEAGDDGKIISYGANFEVVDGVEFYLFNANLDSFDGREAKELDIGLSYKMSEELAFDFIYSNVDDDINGDNFKNSRFFANYSF